MKKIYAAMFAFIVSLTVVGCYPGDRMVVQPDVQAEGQIFNPNYYNQWGPYYGPPRVVYVKSVVTVQNVLASDECYLEVLKDGILVGTVKRGQSQRIEIFNNPYDRQTRRVSFLVNKICRNGDISSIEKSFNASSVNYRSESWVITDRIFQKQNHYR